MASTTYLAQRSLKGGVDPDDEIDFDFDISSADRKTKPKRKDHISLDGSQESVRERTDILYRIKTLPVIEANFDDFRQFLDSVDGGEAFVFDVYGTIASPVDPQPCKMQSKGYTEKRVSDLYLSATFMVRITS